MAASTVAPRRSLNKNIFTDSALLQASSLGLVLKWKWLYEHTYEGEEESMDTQDGCMDVSDTWDRQRKGWTRTMKGDKIDIETEVEIEARKKEWRNEMKERNLWKAIAGDDIWA